MYGAQKLGEKTQVALKELKRRVCLLFCCVYDTFSHGVSLRHELQRRCVFGGFYVVRMDDKQFFLLSSLCMNSGGWAFRRQSFQVVVSFPVWVRVTVALVQAAFGGTAFGGRLTGSCTEIFFPKLSLVQAGSHPGEISLFDGQAPGRKQVTIARSKMRRTVSLLSVAIAMHFRGGNSKPVLSRQL